MGGPSALYPRQTHRDDQPCGEVRRTTGPGTHYHAWLHVLMRPHTVSTPTSRGSRGARAWHWSPGPLELPEERAGCTRVQRKVAWAGNAALARRLDENKVKWASHVDDDVREWRKTWRSRNKLTERADSSGVIRHGMDGIVAETGENVWTRAVSMSRLVLNQLELWARGRTWRKATQTGLPRLVACVTC